MFFLRFFPFLLALSFLQTFPWHFSNLGYIHFLKKGFSLQNYLKPEKAFEIIWKINCFSLKQLWPGRKTKSPSPPRVLKPRPCTRTLCKCFTPGQGWLWLWVMQFFRFICAFSCYYKPNCVHSLDWVLFHLILAFLPFCRPKLSSDCILKARSIKRLRVF